VPFRLGTDDLLAGRATISEQRMMADHVGYGCFDCELSLDEAMETICTGPTEGPPRGILH
jgi:hypothetical protein